MSTMGTFDAFTTARLGIYAAQHGLRVTGNNVSNINTVGYTRQRLDQVSFKAGAYDMYRSQLDNHVGSGALVMNINQVRDPYLDVRYRNTSAEVGYNDTMLAGLQNIADILDEVGQGEDASSNEKGDGILYAQILKLADELRKFEKEPTKLNDTLVRTAAESLCSLLNKYADKLDALYQETVKDFDDQVTEINECLTNIRDLNREIRDCEVYGDNALELRDERNRQIDKLSEYIHIKVVYSEEDIGAGQKVEKLSIYLHDDNPDSSVHTDEAMLIDGIFGAQLYAPESRPMINPDYDPNHAAGADVKVACQYLTQAIDPNGEPWYLDPNDPNDATNKHHIPVGDPIPDGYVPYPGGYTNDPTEAIQVEGNDHFFLQISKLVDAFDKEWTGISSARQEIDKATQAIVDGLAGGAVGATDAGWTVKEEAEEAEYKFAVTASGGWKDGDVIQVGENAADTVTIKFDNTNKVDLVQLAHDIAVLYTAPVNGYEVTDDGAGNLIYKAVDPGRVGKNGPPASAQAPKYTYEPKNDPNNPPPVAANAKISFDLVDSYRGKETVLEPPVPTTTTDEFGTETTTSYRQVDGTWYEVTTTVKHTYETALDDNDLYGSLQATRELLTEAGEFAKQDIVDNIDENAVQKRGIPYYRYSLDLLAKQFAAQYNQINQGVQVDQNGNVVYKSVTGTPTELGLKAVEVTNGIADGAAGSAKANYYVDKNGYYVGLTTAGHQPECLLTKAQINTSDSPETIAAKIKESNPTLYAKYQTALTPDENGQVNKENAQFVLYEFLKTHGVLEQTKAKPDDPETEVSVNAPISMGGVLFSNRNDNDDPEGINASNISVAHSWSIGAVQLVPKYEVLFDGGVNNSTQNTNAGHMINMIERDLGYDPRDIVADAAGKVLFNGNFSDMFNNINITLGKDIRSANIGVNTSYTMLVEIDTSRDGVSGVDLNDEAMNVMQFQKAMNAAMRVMTAIDEALDRLINNTGIAGR